ncbi:MAG: sigma-70 family RNA polymerase sigma factor [Candidatus Hydrogenedentales bacterium]|jgi:RNA polymerase sigma-70 factor (ECF subfamily)
MASDLALLTRWAERREGAAFKEIVSSYAPMVYATCVRVLGDAHEAEDIAQECFETLVSSPKKPDKHLGAWLHRVATNRSLDRMRSERRRKMREAHYAEQAASASHVHWDDIGEHIDSALSELPEELRIPVVAYHLQDQKHEDIARSLNVSRRTVARRIDRGVELLAESLRKRGVIGGVGALVSFMASEVASAAPIPATLTASLGRITLTQLSMAPAGGAAGVGLGGVFVLKVFLGFVVALAIVVSVLTLQRVPEGEGDGASTVARVSPGASGDDTGHGDVEASTIASIEPSGDPVSAESVFVVVEGRVQDEKGNPIEGAAVRLVVGEQTMDTETGADGLFSFADVPVDVQMVLTGTVAELGSAHLHAKTSRDGRPVILTISGGAAGIEGQVVDMEGQPVANVEVQLTPQPTDDQSWYHQPEPKSTSTDSRGMFSAHGLQPGPYAAYVSSPQFTVDAAVAQPIVLKGKETLRNVLLTVPFSVETGIEGYVVDENGEALSGVKVTGQSIFGFDHGVDQTKNEAAAETDASGYFRLEGIVDPVDLVYAPPAGTGLAEAWVTNVVPGSADVNATLFPASIVSGRVTDATSGLSITDFNLQVWSIVDSQGIERHEPMDAEVSKEKGRFTVAGLPPGAVTLWISAKGHAGKLLRDIPIAAGSESEEIKVALGPPCVLETPFVVDGEPLKGYVACLEVHSGEKPRVLNRFMFRHSDSNPTVTIDTLPEGTYLVRGSLYNGAFPFIYRSSQQSTVTLTSGKTTRFEFNFTNRGGVRGHVTAPGGSARCVIVVYDPTQVPTQPNDCLIYGVAEYRLTGAEGAYEIPYLDPGEYLVTAYASEVRFDFHRAQTIPVTVVEGEVAEVNFDLASGQITSGLPR